MGESIIKRINAVAPIRICDIGGWTDTWFSRFGTILNFATYPCVEVQIDVIESFHSDKRVTIALENYKDVYNVDPDNIKYDKHPLIEAAIDVMDIPAEYGFRINIYSEAPPGASTGTSAAVSVALIGALDMLTEGVLVSQEIAEFAHFIETEKLGLQCGIQDQLSSAFGGISYIKMYKFPHAGVSTLSVPQETWWNLEQMFAVVYIGSPHSSSEVHIKVIEKLGDSASNDDRLVELRQLAAEAKEAVLNGKLGKLGKIMNRNTEVQRRLHKNLVCDKFEEVIDICGHYNVLGCKVNGAGGDGGSLTILTNGDMFEKRELINILHEKGYHLIPVHLSRYGLRVWESEGFGCRHKGMSD